MIDLRVAHQLGAEGARERVESLARRHGVRLQPRPDGLAGEMDKDFGWLGSVRARYEIGTDDVAVTVTEAPALLPESTIRRALAGELEQALAG